MSKIVEGLRGDAFIIARTAGLDAAGLDALTTEGDEWSRPGVEVLTEAMKSSAFPLTTHEAKVMLRQYCKPTGALSRQGGESTYQYVSRRRQC
jgi:hypothetical protein